MQEIYISTGSLSSVLALLVIVSSTPAQAQTQTQATKPALKYGMTDMEIAMLPDYCRARLVGDEQSKEKWRQQMGNEKFIHLHHYCSGLNAFKRAKVTVDSRTRATKLEFAAKEFDYVLRSWPADFYLAKEAQGMKAQIPLIR